MGWRRVIIAWLVAGVAMGAAAAVGARGQSPYAAAKDASLWSLEGGDGGAGPGTKISAGVVRVSGEAGRAGGAGRAGACQAEKGSAMYRRVRGGGVVGAVEARDLRAIGSMVLRKPVGLEPDEHAVGLYTFSMCGDGGEVRRVEVVMSPDGSVWSRAVKGGEGEGKAGLESLDRERFLMMVDEEGWGWYDGEFAAEAGEGAEKKSAGVQELAKPYAAGRFVLDGETISKRLLRGRTSRLDRSDRVLEIEKLYVRLPAGYSAREPAGLVVWMNAGDEGEPPECLFEALDKLNLIAAGFARCGNTRPVANRYQLALDAVATVSRRYHVDARRVYATGISGGGRVASILTACFPDIFTGAVPMAGLSCPEAIPAGQGKYIPPAYAKPSGKLMEKFRQRRIGAITGMKDFNSAEIGAAAQVLRGAGAQAKVFTYPELGHTLPSAAQFAEALAWVDEPYQKTRQAEVEAGKRALKAVVGSAGVEAFKVRNESDRAGLMRVTEVAPWTPSAWTAMEVMERK